MAYLRAQNARLVEGAGAPSGLPNPFASHRVLYDPRWAASPQRSITWARPNHSWRSSKVPPRRQGRGQPRHLPPPRPKRRDPKPERPPRSSKRPSNGPPGSNRRA
eukprot:EC834982.1.p3 GENE.EC834982.1~~EC834982.1.p3  ORF type:complete len:105 (-),score=3.03 EC834982.1:229-543(-)